MIRGTIALSPWGFHMFSCGQMCGSWHELNTCYNCQTHHLLRSSKHIIIESRRTSFSFGWSWSFQNWPDDAKFLDLTSKAPSFASNFFSCSEERRFLDGKQRNCPPCDYSAHSYDRCRARNGLICKYSVEWFENRIKRINNKNIGKGEGGD